MKKKYIIIGIIIIVVIIAGLGIFFKDEKEFKEGNININIQSKDIEISSDGKTYGYSLKKQDFIKAMNSYKIKNQLPNSLSRISSVGEVKGGSLLLFSETIINTKSGYLLTSEKKRDVSCNGSCDNYYIAFDLYFKSTEPKTIGLSNNSYVKQKDNNGLDNASRVAFVVEGTVNTSNLTDMHKLSGGTSSIIWEPNNDIHTEEAIKLAKEIYNMDVNGRILSYRGINDIFDELKIDEIETSSKLSDYIPNVSTNKEFTDSPNLFTIQQGITKVRVYVWLEGRDIDMMLETLATDFDINLEFLVK